jgi:hypothetical protein
MCTAVEAGGESTFLEPLAEDSVGWKILSYIPFFGALPSAIQQASLVCKIEKETEIQRIVELIEVKNSYKLGDAVRSLLNAVFCVVAVASGILGAGLYGFHFLGPSLLVGYFLLYAGVQAYGISHNSKIIKDLSSVGIKLGMQIL